MLDEEYTRCKSGGDESTYILGRIGKHNVVIALTRIYGTNPAT